MIARATEFLCWAAWACTRALCPKPDDIASPADLRSFARDCRELARTTA